MQKTFEDCKKEVAQKHGLGKTLVTGHLSKYWEEATILYCKSHDIATLKREYDIMKNALSWAISVIEDSTQCQQDMSVTEQLPSAKALL